MTLRALRPLAQERTVPDNRLATFFKETIMEGRIFRQLYDRVRQLGKTHCFKGKRFSDSTIVTTYLWAVVWDRPISWACRLENWPPEWRWQTLPSPSTLSRRLRTVGVLTLFEQARQALAELFPSGLCKLIDSKPLMVSAYSKDREARVGHGCGFPAKGYKIHAIVDARSRQPACWTLAPMNRHDAAIGASLIGALPHAATAYLIGDNAYDSNTLYEQAAARECQLLAPQRPSAKELGRCRHSPHRIRGHQRLANPLRVVGQPQSFGGSMLAQRIGIEQSFGFMGNIPGGLSPLPNWVRRPRRVALWVAAKMLIVATRQLITKRLN
jgi:hypothetical protein